MDDRLKQQLAFLTEVDKLKQVLRMTKLVGESRRENTAEHTWHMALTAMALAEYADEPIDLLHVFRLILVHDIVEIDAGDTFAYDQDGYMDKFEREQAAAKRLFGLLPREQAAEYEALWLEFETRETAEAQFAAAVDRIQAVLQNHGNAAGTWREHEIALDAIDRRLRPIQDASQELWQAIEDIVQEHLDAGHLKAPEANS